MLPSESVRAEDDAISETLKVSLQPATIRRPPAGWSYVMKPALGVSIYPPIITAIWALLSLTVVMISLYLCGNRLIYSLDDPYITLKLANVILGGGYGINASEYSSPSSSILYPFMVAATQRLGLGSAGPLVLNLIAAGGSVYLGSLFIERYVLGGAVTPRSAWLAYPLGVLLIFVISAVALPMTGLEHSWHVLLIVVMLFEFARMLSTQGEASLALIATIVLAPLFRFEGVVSSFVAILALVYLGRWRAAVVAAMLIVLALVAYGAAMLHLGLPVLPSSVTAKSNIAANVGELSGWSATVKSVVGNLSESLRGRRGKIQSLLVLCIVSAWTLTPAGRERRDTAIVAGLASIVLIAQLVGGKYEGFPRYDVYAVTLGFLVLLYTLRHLIQDWVSRDGWNIQLLALLAGSVLLVHAYVKSTVYTPIASEGRYDQQYQMHRFVADFYREPVAVNDLGWVSYGNNAFVLDLEGLGSESIRRLRAAHAFHAAQMAGIASHYNVGLVMIYESWYPEIPSTWRRVAVLHAPAYAAGGADVSFFVTPSADLNLVSRALAEFRSGLPRGATLDITRI
jgi:hypothetical protein